MDKFYLVCNPHSIKQLNKRNFPQVKKYKGIDTRLNFIKSSLYEEDTELSIKQLKKNHKKLFTEKFVERVLTEGIAEYFQYKGQKDPNFIDSAWPETILDFENSLEEEKAIYEGGYSIVKPILDEFGVQNGVDYIVTHVPEIKQLSEFPTYRDKAMQELGGIK